LIRFLVKPPPSGYLPSVSAPVRRIPAGDMTRRIRGLATLRVVQSEGSIANWCENHPVGGQKNLK
jgi:hypothetical protein